MKVRKAPADEPNLLDITFTQCKILARAKCPKTTHDLSEETGIHPATIDQFFTRPDYHPTSVKLPMLCKALGNTLMIEWVVINSGGVVVFPHFENDEAASLEAQLAHVSKEYGEAILVDAKAKLDGEYSQDELIKTDKELQHLIKQAVMAHLAFRRIIDEQRGQGGK